MAHPIYILYELPMLLSSPSTYSYTPHLHMSYPILIYCTVYSPSAYELPILLSSPSTYSYTVLYSIHPINEYIWVTHTPIIPFYILINTPSLYEYIWVTHTPIIPFYILIYTPSTYVCMYYVWDTYSSTPVFILYASSLYVQFNLIILFYTHTRTHTMYCMIYPY